MASKRTYIATAPDGSEHKRTTATRFYEYAILSGPREGKDGWGVIGFSGDLANATKTGNQWRKYGHNIVVVPCRLQESKTRRSTHESVDPAGRTCTVRYAVGGECGKPAVHAFVASTGEVFAECSEHKL